MMVSLQKILFFTRQAVVHNVRSAQSICNSLQHKTKIRFQHSAPECLLTLMEASKLNAETLRVMFSNQETCDFKNIWLRDNCHCEACVHPATHQKLVKIRDLDLDIQPLKVNIDANSSQSALQVHWPNQDGGETHSSLYTARWLYQFRHAFKPESCRKNVFSVDYTSGLPSPQLWNSDIIEKASVKVQFEDFMKSEEALVDLLSHINKYGIALLKGVPCVQSQVLRVAERISFVKQTTFGLTFQVMSKPDPNTHLSYTGRRLELHSDLAYMQNAPSVQLLHCLEAADPGSAGSDAGGISFFVDAFHSAVWLRDNHPHYFDILSKTKLILAFQDAERGRWFRMERPLIEANRNGDIIEMYWTDLSLRPPLLPSDQILPFYKAYKCLAEKLNEEKSQWKFFLKSGDLVIFNNKRVLHGREEYDATKVKRHLEGCYIDLQEAMSLYESLLHSRNEATLHRQS